MRPRVSSSLRVLPLILAIALCMALPPRASAAPLLLTGFPFLKQQHSLTCESSAVSMGTRGVISETQLMAQMPRNPNPNLGFRGNPDGYQGTGLVDYGVYAAPLRAALLRFGYTSDMILYGNNDLVASYLARGWPVVVWVTYQLQPAHPRLGQYNGVTFTLVPHEHALLAVGYDANTIFANDPWTGARVRYTWKRFDHSWGYFGNMALAIQPCALAQPITTIHLTASTSTELKWSWPRASNAVRYHITILKQGKPNTVLFQGDTSVRHISISAPTRGTYEIDVQSLSACGTPSDVVRAYTQVIGALSTPTPTPSPTPQPTGTITSTPVSETAPTATATPTSTALPTASHG